MTPEQEKAIDRVRKLLALAGSANEHEALAASDKAQAIMAELNLTMQDVADAPDEAELTLDNELESDSRPWRRDLAANVALLYFCEYYYSFKKYMTNERKCGYVRMDVHNFAGAPHNVAVCKLMFMYFVATINRLARDGSLQYPVRERARYVTTFQKACARRLAQRLHAKYDDIMSAQQPKSAGSNLPALYVNTKEQIESFLQDQGIDTGGKKRPPVPLSHHGAEVEGRAAAETIGLDVQVNKRDSGPLLEKGK
jgi:hypothetical protein